MTSERRSPQLAATRARIVNLPWIGAHGYLLSCGVKASESNILIVCYFSLKRSHFLLRSRPNPSTIRSAALPSHFGGIAPFFHCPAINRARAGGSLARIGSD